ncbi:MAG: autotransporter outer membrane beta-barrel domain-containing protein [Planctomycetaceae bacterium]|jgi:hypothetical protein|nr:autotransporter outer membrane beta-barrel domain-containing protein [Planctomycetaceae bacterium]
MKNTATRHNQVSNQLKQKERQLPILILTGSRKKYALTLFCSLLLILTALFTSQKNLFAQGDDKIDTVDIPNYLGETVITLKFSADIDADEQRVVEDAAKYWISIINPTGTPVPAVFFVDKSDELDGNAAAVSVVQNSSGSGQVTGVQSILADNAKVTEVVPTDDGKYVNVNQDATEKGIVGRHAEILIGAGWATTTEKSQSGAINNNLLPVIIHEMGHVFGMTTNISEGTNSDGEPNGIWRFGDLTRWDYLLRDNNGAAPDNSRKKIGHNNVKNTTIFEMGDPDTSTTSANPSSITFFGTNAMNVFYDGNQNLINAAGKTGGVPVTGYVLIEDEDENVTWGVDAGGSLSHLDTWNSLLSWQEFRTFQGLIEVEMAVYKDLGYNNIQTRNFFGQSFYVNGAGKHGLESEQQIADRGFGSWTGNGYDTSVANMGMFGIGLHLFGSNLNILQQGTINSAGEGSAGIRIDGVGNFLTTDSNSIIQMSRDNGIGVLAAFGKEHVIVHRGTIMAYADQYGGSQSVAIQKGIAASFDFGLQLFVSDEDLENDSTSSYLRSYYIDTATGKRLDATNGPLVRRFDVTGKLFGSFASIYIGKTAYVDQINLMSGVEIAGNIISEYKSGNLGTSLTFGVLPDENGQAQALPDENFKFVMSNHINYSTTLDPNLILPFDGLLDIGIVGGVTNFNSIRVNSRSLSISKNATLLLGYSPTNKLWDMPYTRISTSGMVANEGVLAGTGEIRIGKWELDDYDSSVADDTDNTDAANEDTTTNAAAGWSDKKIAFWKYSIPKGDLGYEQYFTSSNWFTNRGTISPGIIANSTDTNDIGQYTVGQIDIHGNLMLTADSIYNLTIDGISKDQSAGQWGIDNDAIWVEGSTLMGGKLRVFLTDKFQSELKDLIANSNDDPVTYHIIRSSSFSNAGVSKFSELEFGGDFSDVKISGVYVNPYDSTVAQITLFPNPHYFEEKGNSWNTRSVGRAIDNETWDLPELAFSLLGAKDDPATMNNILSQIATDIRANSIMSGVLNPSRVLFPRIGWGNGQMVSGDRGRINWEINRERTIMNQFSQFRGQTPQRLRNGSIWFDYIGQSISSPSDGNSAGYSTYVNGGIMGGEWNITPHSALGLTVGYGNGATNSGRDKVRVNDYFAGLYFVATPFNQYEFKAYIGLGRQEYTMFHTIFNSTLKDSNTGQVIGIFDRYFGRTDGMTINTSYELTRPIMITERFILRPTFGVDSQHAWQSGFTEEVLSSTNNGLYALSFDDMYLNHNMVRLGLNSESIGPRGSLWLRGFYNFNFGGSSFPTSRARFTQGSNKFDIRGADIGLDAINLGIGFHLWLNAEHSASFITDFNTDIFVGNSGANAFGLRFGILRNF